MSIRSRVGLVVLWGFSLAAAATIARAQAREPIPLENPTIVSGNDVGFRIESHRGQTPVGKIVVRIQGQWVEAALGVGKPHLIAVPLTEQPDMSPLLPGGRRP